MMGVLDPKERATFSIDSAVKEELERVVPKSKRSSFVEAAITHALREEAKKALLKYLDEMPRQASKVDTAEFLRRKRLEWDGRPIEVLEGSGK